MRYFIETHANAVIEDTSEIPMKVQMYHAAQFSIWVIYCNAQSCRAQHTASHFAGSNTEPKLSSEDYRIDQRTCASDREFIYDMHGGPPRYLRTFTTCNTTLWHNTKTCLKRLFPRAINSLVTANKHYDHYHGNFYNKTVLVIHNVMIDIPWALPRLYPGTPEPGFAFGAVDACVQVPRVARHVAWWTSSQPYVAGPNNQLTMSTIIDITWWKQHTKRHATHD